MQRKLMLLLLVVSILVPLAAFGQNVRPPFTTCGNFCYYNWQYICDRDFPNGIPGGDPNYCWNQYTRCITGFGQDPWDCYPPIIGIGEEREWPPENCPIFINLGDAKDQSDFGLTSVEAGLNFNVNARAGAEKTAWSGQRSSSALLVRPNPDGTITSGSNLFGDQMGYENGFEKLRVEYDSNHDGVISAADPLASQLMLWTDGRGGDGAKWDGVAQPAELRPFLAVIQKLWIHDRETGYVDANGNKARWMSKALLVNENGTGKGGRIVRVADWILLNEFVFAASKPSEDAAQSATDDRNIPARKSGTP